MERKRTLCRAFQGHQPITELDLHSYHVQDPVLFSRLRTAKLSASDARLTFAHHQEVCVPGRKNLNLELEFESCREWMSVYLMANKSLTISKIRQCSIKFGESLRFETQPQLGPLTMRLQIVRWNWLFDQNPGSEPAFTTCIQHLLSLDQQASAWKPLHPEAGIQFYSWMKQISWFNVEGDPTWQNYHKINTKSGALSIEASEQVWP